MLCLLAQPQAAAAGPASAPVYTRTASFGIPFAVAPADRPGDEPVQVQLHVSSDGGRTWQLYDRVEPARGRFFFRAAGDGQFDFAVRTVGRSGQLRPARPLSPELTVVIDTQPPTLDVRAEPGSSGQVVAVVRAVDPALRPESLVVQFRANGQPNWQVLAVDWRQCQLAPGSMAGRITWWPGMQQGAIQIRAELADRAGNPAVSHAQLALPAAPPANTAIVAPPIRREVSAAGSLPGDIDRWRSGNPSPPGVPVPDGSRVPAAIPGPQ